MARGAENQISRNKLQSENQTPTISRKDQALKDYFDQVVRNLPVNNHSHSILLGSAFENSEFRNSVDISQAQRKASMCSANYMSHIQEKNAKRKAKLNQIEESILNCKQNFQTAIQK